MSYNVQVRVVLISLILIFLPVAKANSASDMRSDSRLVLWEKNIPTLASNTIYKPAIIKYQERIYANYGDTLYVLQESTGEILQAYSPIFEEESYVILNLQIYQGGIYILIANSAGISDNDKTKYYLMKLDAETFLVTWKERCCTLWRYFFLDNGHLYLYNMICSFEKYDLETGANIGTIISNASDSLLWVGIPSYHQELNQVWIYFFREANTVNPVSYLHIERLDISSDQFVDPIIIPIDPSYHINFGIMSFFAMMHRHHHLYAEWINQNNRYELIKINTKTRMIDWVIESEEVMQELIVNLSDKNTLYLREGVNTYRKINIHTGKSIQTWQFTAEFSKNDRVCSASSCMDNMIATRFVSYVAVLDLNSGNAIWIKESEKPDNYYNMAQIGFSAPIIKKTNQSTYQILYSLDDKIGLLELKIQKPNTDVLLTHDTNKQNHATRQRQ